MMNIKEIEKEAIRKITSKAGKARWENIPKEERSEKMRAIALKRWNKEGVDN